MQVAILDDYENVALRLADWSGVRATRRSLMYSTTTLPIPRQSSSGCGRSLWYASCASAPPLQRRFCSSCRT